MEMKKGMLAVSKAGHDAGERYVIAAVDNNYVYLVDGRIRTLDPAEEKEEKTHSDYRENL